MDLRFLPIGKCNTNITPRDEWFCLKDDHMLDYQRIVNVFLQHGYSTDVVTASILWDFVSDEYDANWLSLPTSDSHLFIDINNYCFDMKLK